MNMLFPVSGVHRAARPVRRWTSAGEAWRTAHWPLTAAACSLVVPLLPLGPELLGRVVGASLGE